ncbi:uncharacterized protein SOCEGT47_066470 [Sorangium cellulosum]|uniref:DUF4920 domain-containing protein n=1 Tax=Sorangium cellulosum TaxID=56 RepID=A0A4P2QA14_SORCE|nr:DUF4920 domain-containing protein [Sorangium cellulosum]AUX26088.1 uncharacterized protein SOCEGT47_066470 [Sorangium cellulosum]
MRAKLLASVSFLVLTQLGCSRKEPPGAEQAASPVTDAERAAPMQASAAGIAPLQKKQFGAPITEAATTPLPELLQDPGKFSGKTVRTEGVVSAVCRSMGCWMEIADESGSAHIKMAGHSFFVPKDASGHRAVVQGKMVAADAEEGGACGAKDNCRGEAEKQTGRIAKIELEATGVQFLD